MTKLLPAVLAAAAALALSAPVLAVPITGELSLNGSDTFTSTSISFNNPGNIGGTTGSFATVFGVVPPQITGGVTFNDFTSASSNFQLYSVTEGANMSTLVAAAITSFVFTPGSPLESIDVKGTGNLTLTGFTTTAGNWELTSQGPGGTAVVTFSETSVAAGVSEPSTLSIFGIALLALGSLRWQWGRRNG